MRKLTGEDVFFLSAILDKMNIDVDLNKILDEAKKIKSKEEQRAFAGGKLAMMFVKRIHYAKPEFYEWLSDLDGRPVAELKKLKIKETVDLLMELGKDEELAELFKQAAELSK